MEMNSENYVENAIRTDCIYDEALIERLSKSVRLLHAAMGLCTEAGEFMDNLKKHIFYGKPLDVVNGKEEISDILWYCALAVDEMRTAMNEVLTMNIAKLRLRYPEKFTETCAIDRDVTAERVLLEKDSWTERKERAGNEISTKVISEHEPYGNIVGKLDWSNDAILKPMSNRAIDFAEFAKDVVDHIETYTVPQYGDSPNDLAEEWSVQECVDCIKRYAARVGKNAREGQQEQDFLKITHYAQLARDKYRKQLIAAALNLADNVIGETK